MTLLERIEARRMADACGREDDPTSPERRDAPKPFVPEWRRYVREHHRARVDWGRAA